jgi:hypothetical protein
MSRERYGKNQNALSLAMLNLSVAMIYSVTNELSPQNYNLKVIMCK